MEAENGNGQSMTAYTLRDYIEKHWDGNQAAFARAQGVSRQQVGEWIGKGFIVVDDVLYSQRRLLKNSKN